ncbi:ABC transporter permease [Enterococcus sp. AZ103]|uniref:ABC transporter permease n=1 Tax=Enterococcus sp. AZ103 TaxID=2774628 RepID=UPI003F22F93F
MAKYIVKRLLYAIPLVLLVTILTFILIQLAPYDAVDSSVTPNMSAETIAMIRQQKGLDQPAIVQYFYWLKNIFHWDFGYSLVGHQSIGESLLQKIPNTIVLVLPSYVTALILACILGIFAGDRSDKFSGKLIEKLAGIGIATPTFWLAMLLIYFFGYHLNLLPIIGMRTIGVENDLLDFLKHFILPYITLVFAFTPELIRYIRSATMRQLEAEYVLVQRAFGASKKEILIKHVFKNIMTPIAIQIGIFFPTMITGAIITESIYSWPGVGNFFLTAAKALDYPIIMAIVLLSSVMVIIGNLVADVLVILIDPRIRGGRL